MGGVHEKAVSDWIQSAVGPPTLPGRHASAVCLIFRGNARQNASVDDPLLVEAVERAREGQRVILCTITRRYTRPKRLHKTQKETTLIPGERR